MTAKSPIARLATKQHGNVTRSQLLALGLGEGAIRWRLHIEELHRVHFGVYAVGHPPTTALQTAAAAVLACGPEAALSHYSALTLWGLADKWRFPAHVTSPTDRRHPDIVTHRAALDRHEVRVHLGIRTTTPARALLDCAPRLEPKRLAVLAADARRAGQLSEHQLRAVVDAHPRHPGARHLKALLEDGQRLRSRSALELDFLNFCRRYGLPEPLLNTIVHGYEVDAFFPSHNLIVELDGWDFHRDRHTFESDRRKDADLLAAGCPTIRLTWERLTSTPDQEADRLTQILR